jgi:protein-tyrosine phosphatase
MSEQPISVLFVCMGNICRSPAAEGIFRKMVQARGLSDAFHIDSAGTIGYHAGSKADARMRKAAAMRDYPLDSISRQFVVEDFDRFAHIIAMDRQNAADLRALAPTAAHSQQIRMMTDFARHHNETEIPDPYYGGVSGFDHVLDLLEDACGGLLETLQPAG